MHRVTNRLKFEGGAGAIGSLALHAALFGLVASFTGSKVRLEPAAPPASAAPLMAVIFWYQESTAAPVEDDDTVAAAAPESPDAISLPVPPLPDVQAVAADSFEQARKIHNLDDLEEVERLQGIYVKQINDRVGRLLEATGPRVTSGERCVVYVIQDERGIVLDVDTYECERAPEEQQRLAQVIRAASPLPLPPEGLAMGSYVKLDVSSL